MRSPISTDGDDLTRIGLRRSTKCPRRKITPSRVLRYETLESRQLLSTYYVSSSGGNDAWNGLAAAYVSGTTGPWQTVAKVDSVAFAPGDNVLFKRGDVFRGTTLVGCSGTAAGRVTYGAYGDSTAALPELLGSTEEDTTTDWTNVGGDIWSTQPAVNLVTTTGSELLPNPSFSSNASNWTFYKNSPASATGARTTTSGQWDSSPAGYKVYNITNDGNVPGDIQLYTSSLSIISGNYYLLSFDAKCTSSFALAGIILQGNASPYTYDATVTTSTTPTITTGWATYKVIFLANTTASNVRLDFYLGGVLRWVRPSI